MDELISTKDAAKIIGTSPRNMSQWRTRELFGVLFFTADVKRGDTWYYYRERVEQLAAVYQPGILQNMYKLARKFKGENLSDCFQKPGTKGGNFSIAKITPKYFPQDEVIQFLEITERTLFNWRENGKFKEDMTDHEGVFWYSAERVYQMKSSRTKAAQTDSDVSITGDEGTKGNSPKKQQIDNLPDELLTQPRFFRVGGNDDSGKFNQKRPIDKWNNTDNQFLYNQLNYTDTRQMAGFDIVGHGRAADYLCLDFDHVFNNDGTFKHADIEKWFNYAMSIDTYFEKSFSGDGYHFLLKPSDGEFHAMAGGKPNSLFFIDGNSDTKIEIFYKPNGRYFLLTGWVDGLCDPKTPISTDCDIVHHLLAEIRGKQNYKEIIQADSHGNNFVPRSNPELAIECLKYIPCDGYKIWCDVGMILHHNGNTVDDWDNWSKTDKREGKYIAGECAKKWKSFDKQVGKPLTIGSLIFWAMQNGFTPPKRKDNGAHHVVLTEELAKINKAIADFDAEKSAAIETLKNLETFGSDLVFADEIINAAAFAKLYDRENYSAFIRDVKLYGDKHPAEKAMINDLKAVVKDAAVEIAARDTELHFQRSSIGGKISTKNFLKQLPPELQNITIPADYSLSLENGITRIDRQGKKPKILPVCARPVIIARKTKDVAEKKFKWILLHWTSDGKIFSLPPFDASILCSARRIVDIANYGLPVSSEDAFYLAGYLNRFHVANENSIPQTCTVSHCGWHTFNDADIFVDPRRNSTIEEGGKNCPLIAAETSNFARTLTSKGKLSEWKKACDLARISPISRCIVAASVAAPLLKVLGEINFLLYIHTTTGAGKTTSLYLGASAVGSEKMIRSFDATKNGLLGAAADVSDYSFLVDEKQTADNRLKDQLSLLVMALANGIGRTKLNSDSTVKNLTDWRTIAIMTGETTLLADNATGGTFRRTLQLRAPKVILPPATCKAIKDIIKENYGLVFAPLIDKIFAYGKDNLRTAYQKILSTFTQSHSAVLDEYRRYIAIISLADYLLNIVLGDDEKSAADSALANADEIFKFVPTNEEIDDDARALAFLKSFVAGHTKHFYTMPSGTTTPAIPQANEVYGQIDFTDEVLFLPHALKKILENEGGFSATKIIADFAERGYLIKSSGRGNYYRKRNFGGNGATTRTDVYRFKAGILRGDDDIPATTAEEIKSFDEEFQGVDLPDGQSPFDFDN